MLDTWRRCDSDRVRAQLEMSYMEAYAMYVASQLALEEQERALERLNGSLGMLCFYFFYILGV